MLSACHAAELQSALCKIDRQLFHGELSFGLKAKGIRQEGPVRLFKYVARDVLAVGLQSALHIRRQAQFAHNSLQRIGARKGVVVETGVFLRAQEFRCQFFKDVLRNSMLTIVTLLSLSVGSLLGGTAAVERIFVWRGMGFMVMDAILARDYPVIQAFVVWMAVIYVVINLLTDLSYYLLDPRMRQGLGVR